MDAAIFQLVTVSTALSARTEAISAETSRIRSTSSRDRWMLVLAVVLPLALSGIGIIGAVMALVVAFHK